METVKGKATEEKGKRVSYMPGEALARMDIIPTTRLELRTHLPGEA